ncbi:dienelactone hydrolase family protein [Conexibacter sp. CPCC 206217]|uniref:dienelactone hydrolase family protein n=1 Tax=Conexibacter sp. CPCC 206217 TaxID=3064574 RepID=UPI00272007E7|nr:dienelactone hydrolase family protein [Conexibacter sp. CPCC 206217]MDO8212679.1 dienelactone hydrolase family protein [Conexibacter sp. CPCC 206217]
MCFDADALPPDLPVDLARAPMAGGAGAELLELTSADGTRFSAALAEAPDPQGAAVVILPDVRGLFRFYSELAERFAQAGHHAIVIDYFGRTAGLAPRDAEFEYMPHVAQTTPAQIQADAAAAIAALHARVGEVPVVTVGFCFGGRQSFFAAAAPALGLAGVVAFYGGLGSGRPGMPTPLGHEPQMRGPILGLFGGADPSIPQETVDEFDGRLTAANVDHEFVVYPGAPHSFFDRSQEEHADASADAWRRVLGFLRAVATPALR